jgi:transcriptional regulator with XRE-family HTH domain
MTQEQLAEKAGVSVFTVHRAENGIRISLLSQERIAQALDTPREMLFPEQQEATA